MSLMPSTLGVLVSGVFAESVFKNTRRVFIESITEITMKAVLMYFNIDDLLFILPTPTLSLGESWNRLRFISIYIFNIFKEVRFINLYIYYYTTFFIVSLGIKNYEKENNDFPT